MISHFNTIPKRDGHTDNDRTCTAISRVSTAVLMRGKNETYMSVLFILEMGIERNSNTTLSERRARTLPETLEKLMFLSYNMYHIFTIHIPYVPYLRCFVH